MAVSAAQVAYREEMIAAFEVNQSLLRGTVTTEAVIKGNQAKFLVSGSGGSTAVTRGTNGLIPSRTDTNTQSTATLVEWHDKPSKTDFDIFASQGDQRSLMQRTSVGVINRQIDSDIITVLNTGSVTTGSATTASLNLVLRAKTMLQNADVPWDNNLFALVSPAFEGYLNTIDAYSSQDYIEMKTIPAGGNAWSDRPKMKYWMGVNWITHPNVPAVGTSAAKCFMYHKSAIGHAVDSRGINAMGGYNDEDHYYWYRTSVYMGSVLLQNAGVVVMTHDDTALSS